MAKFDEQKLTGGRIKMVFASTEPGVNIEVWCHPPRPEELALAVSSTSLEIQEDGNIKLPDDKFSVPVEMYNLHIQLARRCIDTVVNLDDWPVTPRCLMADGVEALTDAAFAMLPRPALANIGKALWEQIGVSADEGNA